MAKKSKSKAKMTKAKSKAPARKALLTELDTILFRAMDREPKRGDETRAIAICGQLTLTPSQGAKALRMAADADASRLVKALMAAGVPPDPKGSAPSPLHEAASQGSAKAVRALLAAGADPNRGTMGSDRSTALMAAAAAGDANVVGILLAAGADPSLEDYAGDTALDHLEGVEFAPEIEKPVRTRLEKALARVHKAQPNARQKSRWASVLAEVDETGGSPFEIARRHKCPARGLLIHLHKERVAWAKSDPESAVELVRRARGFRDLEIALSEIGEPEWVVLAARAEASTVADAMAGLQAAKSSGPVDPGRASLSPAPGNQFVYQLAGHAWTISPTLCDSRNFEEELELGAALSKKLRGTVVVSSGDFSYGQFFEQYEKGKSVLQVSSSEAELGRIASFESTSRRKKKPRSFRELFTDLELYIPAVGVFQSRARGNAIALHTDWLPEAAFESVYAIVARGPTPKARLVARSSKKSTKKSKAKPTQTKKPGARRFECRQGRADKFWEIEVSNNQFEVHFGRRGTAGQRRTKKFGSKLAATAAAEEKISEKLEKGYREV